MPIIFQEEKNKTKDNKIKESKNNETIKNARINNMSSFGFTHD